MTIECDHNWKWVKDWMGDSSIPNGTLDCSHWECSKCDSVAHHAPPPQRDDEYEHQDRERD